MGKRLFIYDGSHVAHDAKINDNVIIANCGAVAGCIIEDDVIIGGLSEYISLLELVGVQLLVQLQWLQRCYPLWFGYGPRGSLDGLNIIGLKRKVFKEER